MIVENTAGDQLNKTVEYDGGKTTYDYSVKVFDVNHKEFSFGITVTYSIESAERVMILGKQRILPLI